MFLDHFHKWWPIINSFASIKISLTNLILKLIIQKSFYSQTKLVKANLNQYKNFKLAAIYEKGLYLPVKLWLLI